MRLDAVVGGPVLIEHEVSLDAARRNHQLQNVLQDLVDGVGMVTFIFLHVHSSSVPRRAGAATEMRMRKGKDRQKATEDSESRTDVPASLQNARS